MSSTPYDISALLKEVNTNALNLGRDNEEARRQCLAAARSLCYALETPVESVIRMNWAEVCQTAPLPSHLFMLICTKQAHHAALRTCIDLKVFEKM